MKNAFLIVSLVLVTFGSSFGQSFDNSLLVGFSQEELETMQKNNPGELAFWEFFVNEGFVFRDYPAGKKGALDPSTAISVSDEKSFNPLSFGFAPHKEARVYYPIINSERMVMILPRTEINVKLKAKNTK